jgi:hypothetical protein
MVGDGGKENSEREINHEHTTRNTNTRREKEENPDTHKTHTKRERRERVSRVLFSRVLRISNPIFSNKNRNGF